MLLSDSFLSLLSARNIVEIAHSRFALSHFGLLVHTILGGTKGFGADSGVCKRACGARVLHICTMGVARVLLHACRTGFDGLE